jgi:hypothetical protein
VAGGLIVLRPIYLYKYRPEENIRPMYYLDIALSNIIAGGATDEVKD